jgi:actin-related protein
MAACELGGGDLPAVALDLGSSRLRVALCEGPLSSSFLWTDDAGIRGVSEVEDGDHHDGIPALIGRPHHTLPSAQSVWFGRDALGARRSILSIRYPVEYGTVTNWDDVEELLNHAFRCPRTAGPARQEAEETPPVPGLAFLNLNSKETLNRGLELGLEDAVRREELLAGRAVVLALEWPTPKANLEKMTQTMFERFGCARLVPVPSAVLALAAQRFVGGGGNVGGDIGGDGGEIDGDTGGDGGEIDPELLDMTGFVVDLGHADARVTPVLNGHVVEVAVHRCNVECGRAITECLSVLLTENVDDLDIMTTQERYEVGLIKERRCFVASSASSSVVDDASDEHQPVTSFEFPHSPVAGQRTCTCEADLFSRAVEDCLFSPIPEHAGLHEQVANNLRRIRDPELRAACASNVVVIGATARLPGLHVRLQKELSAMDDMGNVRVSAFGSRNSHDEPFCGLDPGLAAFAGAGIVGQTLGRGDTQVSNSVGFTVDDYDEHGPSLIHRYALGLAFQSSSGLVKSARKA